MRTKSLAERFWAKVDKSAGPDGCWLWMESSNPKGYGYFGMCGGGKWSGRMAHRVAWELERGETGDLWVLHKCDNPACVNPAHLWLGTAQDNTNDALAKGRLQNGDWHWTALKPELIRRGEARGRNVKLKDADIPVIRSMTARGIASRVIAKQFGVTHSAIQKVASGATWSHVH